VPSPPSASSLALGLDRFDPAAIRAFRFVDRSIDDNGRVRLVYALDKSHTFVETYDIPLEPGASVTSPQVEAALDLLHWTAGVSYYKAALPGQILLETGAPTPAVAALLDALYSEGLGELAYKNAVPIPRPMFASLPGGAPPIAVATRGPRFLVPIGGGKDSVVGLEIVRASGCELCLFSMADELIGDAPPIRRTVEAAGLPRLMVRRTFDFGQMRRLAASGAVNGHIPITAVIASLALLSATINGFTAVVLSNERSASSGNVIYDGTEINHQFSKSLRAERLLRAAAAETSGVDVFSVLRQASELSIARAFARLPSYHDAFTSCNRMFHLDPSLRAASWCCDCEKCRFVFLMMAPFTRPEHLERIFGHAMLRDLSQYGGFVELADSYRTKPFECVGTREEVLVAIGQLATSPDWRDQPVVQRLAARLAPRGGELAALERDVLALSSEHFVPGTLTQSVRALLGS
jgi:hypothetical protein